MNTAKKLLVFQIIYTKKNYELVNILKKTGLIKSFCFLNVNNSLKIKISPFFYKNLPVCKRLKLLSKPSKSLFISFKALKLLHNRTNDSIFFLSTTKGVITHLDALRAQIGGKLITRISI